MLIKAEATDVPFVHLIVRRQEWPQGQKWEQVRRPEMALAITQKPKSVSLFTMQRMNKAKNRTSGNTAALHDSCNKQRNTTLELKC